MMEPEPAVPEAAALWQHWGVVHETRYTYATPVIESVNEARLRPLERPGRQVVEAFSLTTTPGHRGRTFRDFYGNSVHYLEVTEPHRALTVRTESVVAVAAVDQPSGGAGLDGLADHSFVEWVDFVGPSHLTSVAPVVWRRAVDAVPTMGSVKHAALALLSWVHTNLAYVPDSTTVATAAEDVLTAGRGVCQDFTHVFLSLCRCLKIPARYVSGYVGPGPGRETGEGAMHAWAEVLVPGHGWWGLDPTAGRPVGAAHVAVAVGRDYADVRPISGTYRGGERREMTVQVSLTRLGSGLAGHDRGSHGDPRES